MKGVVDDSLRALLDITTTRDGQQHNLQVWVDTAFNGGLVIPRTRIEALGLKQASTTQAILADGSVVDLENVYRLFELVRPRDPRPSCCQ